MAEKDCTQEFKLDFEGEGTDSHAVLAPTEGYGGAFFTVIIHGGNEDRIAQRIQTAVNQHASLLRCAEALRKALPFIDDALDAHTVMSETCVTQKCMAVVDEANAALSSLEKRNG